MFEVKNLSLAIFCLSILVLSGLACVSPWWEASTTKENEILNGVQLKIEYLLKGSVDAFKIDPNYQITALRLNGKLNLGKNVTLGLNREINSVRIPKIGLGTFYSRFEGEAIVKRSQQGYYSVNFVGKAVVDNTTITLNFTHHEDALKLEEKTYSSSGELELTTSPVTISIMDLDSSEDVKYRLKFFFDIIWALNIVGLGLNVTFFALMLLYILTRKTIFYIFLRYALVIATIIPLITFFLFANDIQGLISKLNNVAPPEVYTLTGSDIKALIGGTKDIIYGPSVGWKLVFVIFIMNAALLKLIGKIREEKKFSKVLNIA